jgi:hypothetical protein
MSKAIFLCDVEIVSTPALVREYAALKYYDESIRLNARERHERLSNVVDELRRRNVLD